MLTMGVLSVGGRPDITCAGFASHSILTVIRKIVMFSIVEIPNRVRENGNSYRTQAIEMNIKNFQDILNCLFGIFAILTVFSDTDS